MIKRGHIFTIPFRIKFIHLYHYQNAKISNFMKIKGVVTAVISEYPFKERCWVPRDFFLFPSLISNQIIPTHSVFTVWIVGDCHVSVTRFWMSRESEMHRSFHRSAVHWRVWGWKVGMFQWQAIIILMVVSSVFK